MTEPPTDVIGEFIDAAVQDEARARFLLSQHPELLNARWHLGETVLHFLAVEGYVEAVLRLAEWGADVNLVNRLGEPPLIDCVLLGNESLVALLLSHGADPNVVSAAWGPLLHAAVTRGRPGVVRQLLAAGADPRARNSAGETVFDVAPARPDQHQAILAVFSEFGIQPHAG